ncbi:MAG: T9SS type A sorting domain-containing protein [Bacteroidetes bacterium]|nr:T9SS type A sorting domain-containing protein [Bacteroidota bacterium]MCW5894586.1 T9SS type A sorting domain-containing protein [Bacteroidota bacterium]
MRTRVAPTIACIIVLFLAAGVASREAHAQTQVTLDASKDNTLYEDPSGSLSNGAGPGFFTGKTIAGAIRRGLLAFDVAGGIPANATITNVTLTLTVTQAQAIAQVIGLHRASADWGEGTSIGGGTGGGAGGPATTGDATWLHRFFNTTLWTTPGGDFAATPSATSSVGGLGTYTWASTPALVADVQQWLDTPSSNFGWVIVGGEGASATAKRFDSREHPTPSSRPKLAITYTGPTSVPQETPHTFALHQNFPNPFNPSTTIRFELAQPGRASLKIFNLLGQEIATLVDGNFSAGAHSVAWDAAEFSTGVYVYRLEAAGNVATRKLVLAR